MVRDELIPLFPQPLMVCSYDRDYKKELAWIKKQKYRRGILNEQSEDTFILDNKELKKIRTFFETKLNKFATEVLQCTNKFVITQSWLNRAGKGESHHTHTHSNSIVSGVWYPHTHEKLPPIQFFRDRDKSIELNTSNFNHFNNDSFLFPAKSGELLLFPSIMRHGVLPNKYEEKRISLSFNTWVKGDLGDVNRLTSLPIDRLI